MGGKGEVIFEREKERGGRGREGGREGEREKERE